ncbi:hypothetical protein ASC94_10135 [Massilia sp. Root418]|uniref:phage tail length tape measure family protein n=1 Tax=Massilia sp. Root418 TaxID=1736532 RepID=UPI0006FAAB21|nr:phage tail length tape measure family protein [Massilia sp. Root418]KQW97140.1 hypothetical protein ASC94_10135 [Massilia sp. Root418]
MSNTVGSATIELAVDSSGVESGLQRADGAITRTGRSLSNLGTQGAGALNAVGAGAERSASSVERAQNRLIGSIQRTTAAMEAGGRSSAQYFEVLARQRGVDPAALTPYLNQLRAIEGAQNSAGMSARATAAALRGVPAQITDIITSLQGGQAPLTVLLQQGGQLRDMFGSVGGAARALGSSVMGLITPISAVAVAVLALGVAYHQGSQEALAYNRALILTGNAAGTTSNQLSDMARDISKTVGTQGAAAEALAALAGTGQVGVANLQRFGQTAVQVQKTIGQSAAETATIFAGLADEPLKASEKLSKQYNYLTGAVYAQIKALEDQGRTQEAGEVAQKAYADAMDVRAAKLAGNLSTMEKAWSTVSGVAKKAWDAMLDIGREDTLQEKLTSAEKRLQSASKNRFGFIGSGEYKEAQAAVEALKGQIDAETRLAALDAARDKFNKADIAWQKQKEQGLTRELQMQKEVALVRQKGLDAGASDAEIAAQVGEVRKKYADIAFKGINDQIDAIERRGSIEEEVAKRAAAAVASARANGFATSLAAQIDYAERAEKFDQEALAREKRQLQQRIALQKQLPDSPESRKAIADMQGQIALKDEQALTRKASLKEEIIALDVKDTRQAAKNYADLEKARESDLDALNKQIQAQRDANAVIGMSTEQANEFNKSLVEETAQRLENEAAILSNDLARQGEAETMRKTADAMRTLAQEQRAAITKSAQFEQQKKVWESIDQTAHDTFVNIFEGGKSAFDRLRDTLKSGLLDLLYQMTVKKWIFNIGAQVTGSQGIAGLGQGVSGVSSLFSTASNASSLYNGASTVAGWLGIGGAALGSGVAAGAGALGAGAAVGTGALGSGVALGSGLLGSGAAASGALGSGVALGSGALGTGAAASTGLLGSASAALAAIPVWGWAALAAAAVVGFMQKGPEKNTRLTFTSNNTPGNISINERGNEGKVGQSYIDGYGTGSLGTFGLSSTFWSDGFSDTVQSFISTVTKVDDVLASYLTTSEKSAATAAVSGKAITANLGAQGTDQNGKGELDAVFAKRLDLIFDSLTPGMSSLIEGFKGTSQELATEATALLQYRQALNASGEAVFGAKVSLMDLAALKAPTEATSAALIRITDEFTVTNAVAAALGKTTADAFGQAGLASLGAREQLIALSGGMDALAANTGSFAQNYLSEAERLAPVAKSVEAALAGLGLASVDTRDEFKQVVTGLDLTTEAGAKQYAQLMGLQEAFAAVHPAIAATTGAAREAADIAQERANIQKELDQFGLTEAEKQRAAIDATNLALYDSLEARVAEKAAIDAAAQSAEAAAAALATTESSIQADIDALVRASLPLAEQRALDVKDMAASTLALYERREALQAEAKAIEDAKAAAAAAAAQRAGIELNIAKLLGNTTLARERELAALDATSQALQQHAYALTDAEEAVTAALSDVQRAIEAEKTSIQAAAGEQIKAIRDGADARQAAIASAQKGVDSLTRIFDDIAGAVKTLRGDVAGQTNITAARSFIDMALSLAQTGVMPDVDRLRDAIGTVTQDKREAYGSIADFEFAQLVQAGKLEALGKLAGVQKSIAEQQFDAFTTANKLADEQIKAIEKAAADQSKALDAQWKTAQDAVSAMRGVDLSVKSVGAAIQGLNSTLAALAATRAGASAATGISGALPTSSTPVGGGASAPAASQGGSAAAVPAGGQKALTAAQQAYFDAIKSSAGDVAEKYEYVAGLQDVQAMKSLDAVKGVANDPAESSDDYMRRHGYKVNALASDYKTRYVPAFAGGGDHAGGLRVVGERGMEIEATGPSRIWNFEQTSRMLSGGGNSEEMTELVRMLREQNGRLEAQNKRLEGQLSAISDSTRRTRDLLDQVTSGGNSMRCEVVKNVAAVV